VALYADAIGLELNLSDDEMKALKAAALLHDIGKLAVPEYIISKPGRLTEEEFEKMKIHPVVGAEILEPRSSPRGANCTVAPRAMGRLRLPHGLKGEDIPIGARILGGGLRRCHGFDRLYRRLPLEEVIAYGEGGGQEF
jgi:putative nucleotidyltransferase with HDIG domain